LGSIAEIAIIRGAIFAYFGMLDPNSLADKTPTLDVSKRSTGEAMVSGLSIDLGISGLPDLNADMVVGGLYALNVRTSSARFPLFMSSAKNAIESGMPCYIITATAPQDLLSRLESCGDFPASEFLLKEKLIVMSMQDEFSKKIFRFGADRFVQELEDAGVPEDSYLIFDQADDLLSLHDLFLASQQIKILSKWFARRRITGLLAFNRSNEQRIDALNALLDDLTGIARLGGERDGIEVTFNYWRAGSGVIAARNFNLYTTKHGNYAVSRRVIERPLKAFEAETQNVAEPIKQVAIAVTAHNENPSLQSASEADLADTTLYYVYTDPELDALQGKVLGKLRRVDGLFDVLQACLNRPKSFVILTLDEIADFPEFARTVHRLRSSLGARAKIVVRERALAVSDDQKKFLLQCGANTVIGQDVSISQFSSFFNAIRNQVYSRPLEIDFDRLISELLPKAAAQVPVDVLESPVMETDIKVPGYSYKPDPSLPRTGQRVIERAKRSVSSLAS
jgi:Cellulose biosynthesis GIL